LIELATGFARKVGAMTDDDGNHRFLNPITKPTCQARGRIESATVEANDGRNRKRVVDTKKLTAARVPRARILLES